MRECRREISKEDYEIAKKNNGFLTEEQKERMFDASILVGYGLYMPRVYKDGDKYMLRYEIGSSCD